jgi:hypothetical protein
MMEVEDISVLSILDESASPPKGTLTAARPKTSNRAGRLYEEHRPAPPVGRHPSEDKTTPPSQPPDFFEQMSSR